MIMPIDAEIALDKIQHPFMIKTLSKVGTEGTCRNITKAIYETPTANYTQWVKTRQECLLSPLFYTTSIK